MFLTRLILTCNEFGWCIYDAATFDQLYFKDEERYGDAGQRRKVYSGFLKELLAFDEDGSLVVIAKQTVRAVKGQKETEHTVIWVQRMEILTIKKPNRSKQRLDFPTEDQLVTRGDTTLGNLPSQLKDTSSLIAVTEMVGQNKIVELEVTAKMEPLEGTQELLEGAGDIVQDPAIKEAEVAAELSRLEKLEAQELAELEKVAENAAKDLEDLLGTSEDDIDYNLVKSPTPWMDDEPTGNEIEPETAQSSKVIQDVASLSKAVSTFVEDVVIDAQVLDSIVKGIKAQDQSWTPDEKLIKEMIVKAEVNPTRVQKYLGLIKIQDYPGNSGVQRFQAVLEDVKG